MIVKALRVGLGQLIVFGDLISRPAKRKRNAAAQAAVEQQAKGLAL
ncbi:MAG: glutaredoxin, partial [Pseudomonas sp.]